MKCGGSPENGSTILVFTVTELMHICEKVARKKCRRQLPRHPPHKIVKSACRWHPRMFRGALSVAVWCKEECSCCAVPGPGPIRREGHVSGARSTVRPRASAAVRSVVPLDWPTSVVGLVL